MASLESLLPLVRRHAAGCPDFVILDALRYAAREFCRDSWFVKRTLEVPLYAGQAFYDLEPESADEEIIGVDAVQYLGLPLEPADPKAVFQRSGSPRVFLWLPPATLEIAPYPSADAGSLVDPMFVSVVVQPKETAATYPDDIQREFDHCIADGAVARVCGVEGAAWSSPRLALKHGQIFYTSKMNAKGKALRAHMPRGLRVQPVRFA